MNKKEWEKKETKRERRRRAEKESGERGKSLSTLFLRSPLCPGLESNQHILADGRF
jgi:hypothetical protein